MQAILDFFKNIFNTIMGWFGFGDKKDDDAVAPHTPGTRAGHSTVHSAETQNNMDIARQQAAAAVITPTINADPNAFNRIQVNVFGPDDIEKWNQTYRAHGQDIGDAMVDAYFKKEAGLENARNPGDSRITHASKQAEKKRVLGEHKATMNELDQQLAEKARPPEDLVAFNKLKQNADLAMAASKAGYQKTPDIEFARDIGSIVVSLPEGTRSAELNVTRMPGSQFFSVDVIPAGGTAVHVDNLTLADINSFIVNHPGEGTKITLNANRIDGVGMLFAAAPGATSADVKLVGGASAQRVNYEPRIAQATHFDDDHTPSPTHLRAPPEQGAKATPKI